MSSGEYGATAASDSLPCQAWEFWSSLTIFCWSKAMSPRKLAVVVLAVVASGCSNVVESKSSQYGVVVVSGHLFANPHITAQAHCSKFGKNAIEASSKFYSGLGLTNPAVLTTYVCVGSASAPPHPPPSFGEPDRESILWPDAL